MKQLISKIKILFFIVIAAFMTSCQDFIATDTNKVMFSDETILNSPNDTVYSIVGILSKVQKLSDKYVLIGELRGDLLDVTENSESDLRDLSNFSVDSNSNAFCDVKDYYAVINNCNFLIQKADTTINDKGNKPYIKEQAIAKSIRAWTYMLLVLNYGSAFYFEKPLLTVKETKETFPQLNQKQMVDTLISVLTPIVNIEYPKYGTINNVESKLLYVNVRFLLGDLYLWKASLNGGAMEDFEQAATQYSNLIYAGQYLINSNNAIKWNNQNFTGYPNNQWSTLLSTTVGGSELITTISMTSSSLSGISSNLTGLSLDYKLTSSKRFENLFADQTYAFPITTTVPTTAVYSSGDLRFKATILTQTNSVTSGTMNIIQKYLNPNINIYRTGLLYLRYAEAVNRAGKPGLAYAVLKYGLNPLSFSDPKKIPARDLTPLKNYFTTFNTNTFTYNVGVHNRGCGSSDVNGRYIIPITIKTKSDSINFVENAICDELALETGLEGNRFQDLMRISNYRNDPSFLADKIAQKHTDYSRFYNLLIDSKNWVVPTKK